jgi:hypothetical protein
VVENVDEMAQAVGQLSTIDPALPRVEQRFSAPAMAKRYVESTNRYLHAAGVSSRSTVPSNLRRETEELSPVTRREMMAAGVRRALRVMVTAG